MGKTSKTDFDNMEKNNLNLPKDLGLTIKSHRNRLRISREKLSELSLISVRTIERIENGKVEVPKFETLVALMVGMKLHYGYIEDIITKNGQIGFIYSPNIRKKKESLVYTEILIKAQYMTIAECNELLIANGIAAITDEE